MGSRGKGGAARIEAEAESLIPRSCLNKTGSTRQTEEGARQASLRLCFSQGTYGQGQDRNCWSPQAGSTEQISLHKGFCGLSTNAALSFLSEEQMESSSPERRIIYQHETISPSGLRVLGTLGNVLDLSFASNAKAAFQ